MTWRQQDRPFTTGDRRSGPWRRVMLSGPPPALWPQGLDSTSAPQLETLHPEDEVQGLTLHLSLQHHSPHPVSSADLTQLVFLQAAPPPALMQSLAGTRTPPKWPLPCQHLSQHQHPQSGSCPQAAPTHQSTSHRSNQALETTAQWPPGG